MIGLGPVDWPPAQALIVLTDRDDGTEWFLSHDSDTHVRITDDIPDGMAANIIRRYSANEGPFLGGAVRVRLLVRGQHLGYEIVPDEPNLRGDFQAPPAAWLENRGRLSMTIHPASLIRDGDRVGYRDEELEV